MAAYEAGVEIYAGTDAGGVLPHGNIAGEVRELADYGISAVDALGAASWRARAWLGLDGVLSEGTAADFVIYDRNPLEDLSVLASRGASCCVAGSSAGSLPESPAHPDPEVVAVLRAAGCVFAEEEAAVLLAQATDEADLALMLARRVAGEPLEQVVGWAEFCGLRIAVAPGVFVPRRRTEVLVDLAARILRHTRAPRRAPSSWTSAAGRARSVWPSPTGSMTWSCTPRTSIRMPSRARGGT